MESLFCGRVANAPADHLHYTCPAATKVEIRSLHLTADLATTNAQLYLHRAGGNDGTLLAIYNSAAPTTVSRDNTWIVMNAGDELHSYNADAGSLSVQATGILVSPP